MKDTYPYSKCKLCGGEAEECYELMESGEESFFVCCSDCSEGAQYRHGTPNNAIEAWQANNK